MALSSVSAAQTRYRSARVDSTGQLRIAMSNGRTITATKDSAQVAFEQVAISPDHQTVGWLALYPNCRTTYPVPLKLMVLVNGRQRALSEGGLPVWKWSFVGNGARVALRLAPVHGDNHSIYELRDLRTGRLVSSFEAGPNQRQTAPPWVRELQRPI